MEINTVLTVVSILATSIVGYILYKQIKSQKEIINHYKGYSEAIDPQKIITLHKREIEQLQKLTDNNIQALQKQVIELGIYVDYILTRNEEEAKSLNMPELFISQSVIDLYMPNCSRILKKIHESRQLNKR